MKVILVGVILGALMMETNGYNDNEMKAKMDAMEKRLAKLEAMEKRLAAVEQQEGKVLSTYAEEL